MCGSKTTWSGSRRMQPAVLVGKALRRKASHRERNRRSQKRRKRRKRKGEKRQGKARKEGDVVERAQYIFIYSSNYKITTDYETATFL